MTGLGIMNGGSSVSSVAVTAHVALQNGSPATHHMRFSRYDRSKSQLCVQSICRRLKGVLQAVHFIISVVLFL